MKRDLTNVYKIDAGKGTVKYTIKAHDVYYTGTAKVNKDAGDVFDVEKGQRIAKLRAILKMKKGLMTEKKILLEIVQELLAGQEKLTQDMALLQDSMNRVEAKLYAELNS